MFEFLFKVEPALFARGTLVLDWSWGAYLAAVLGAAILAYLVLTRTGIDAALRRRDRVVLWSVRTAPVGVFGVRPVRPDIDRGNGKNRPAGRLPS